MHIAKIAALVLVSFVVLTCIMIEVGHVLRFRHFAPFGLHADVVVRKADYGIPGISKVYEAKLTNVSIIPVKITVCDFVDDAMERGTTIRTSIERWDPITKKWQNIFKDLDESSWCQPYPLGIVEATVTTKKLLLLQSISGGEGAVAAYDIFAVGDRARFVVFPSNGLAISTAAISIDEHQTVPNVPYRVRH